MTSGLINLWNVKLHAFYLAEISRLFYSLRPSCIEVLIPLLHLQCPSKGREKYAVAHWCKLYSLNGQAIGANASSSLQIFQVRPIRT